jgi:plastocyanin
VTKQMWRPGVARSDLSPLSVGLRVTGGGLLIATAAIHGDLYLTGYKHIPVIGWLFLLQVITAFLLGVAVLVTRNSLIALAGAGFAVATLGGYLLSIWFGLFGFTEVRTTAGIVAGVIEIAAFATLALFVLAPGASANRLVAAASVVALVVLGVTVAGASGPGSTGGGQAGGAATTVVIKDFKFLPAAPHVQPGQRVEVKNSDSVAHTLTAVSASGGQFDTRTINPGQVKFFTAPAKAGTYAFHCTFHPFMTGTLVVGHVSAAAELAAVEASLPALHTYCGLPAARQQAAARLLTLGRL